jgi:hypothetical protein
MIRLQRIIAPDTGQPSWVLFDYSQQPIFGNEKNPSRLVYGVASLPLGTPVELEIIFEVAGK